jgi:hypothetical protein
MNNPSMSLTKSRSSLLFAQVEGKCYSCSKVGHKLPQIRFKDKPKAEWDINKIQQTHTQAGKNRSKTLKTKILNESINQINKINLLN